MTKREKEKVKKNGKAVVDEITQQMGQLYLFLDEIGGRKKVSKKMAKVFDEIIESVDESIKEFKKEVRQYDTKTDPQAGGGGYLYDIMLNIENGWEQATYDLYELFKPVCKSQITLWGLGSWHEDCRKKGGEYDDEGNEIQETVFSKFRGSVK